MSKGQLRPRYPKTSFALDFTTGQLTCPAGVSMAFQPGTTVRIPQHTCAACPQRTRCTTSSDHPLAPA